MNTIDYTHAASANLLKRCNKGHIRRPIMSQSPVDWATDFDVFRGQYTTPPVAAGSLKRIGGLHHRYDWQEAA